MLARGWRLAFTLVALATLAPNASNGELQRRPDAAAEPPSTPGRGASALGSGPASTEAQLGEDARVREVVVGVPWLDETLAPYFAWKDGLEARVGLRFGGDYTSLVQLATADPTDGAAGMYRLFGDWDLLDRGGDFEGSLVFKGESRHRYGGGATPLSLGFEFGSALPTGVPFSNDGWLLSNLFWKQRLGDRVTLLLGQVDTSDYLDLYGLVSPWLHFTNLAFLTNPTIPLPSQGLGGAVGAWLTDRIYAIGGVADPTADPTRPFDDPFGGGEVFAHGELGWTSGRERLLLDNVHATGWYVHRLADRGTPKGWGVSVSASRFVGDRWMPFARGGYARDGGALLVGHAALGLGVRLREVDLLGAAFSWGRPQAPGARDQYTTELFYRLQLLPSLALTPDLQVIVSPASAPDEDVVAVFGLRARLAF
jgi:porin